MLTRRDQLKLLTGAVALSAPIFSVCSTGANAEINPDSVNAAFGQMVAALKGGNLDRFYGAMHPAFTMIDEDSPFRMSKEEFQDHIGFHVSGIWETFEWRPLTYESREFASSGTITGLATFRGKPRDAGFRIRHMMFAQTWAKTSAGWELVLWHQSPVDGHIFGVSPT